MQNNSHANRGFFHSRYSLCFGSCVDQGSFSCLDGVAAGIRAAGARSEARLRQCGVQSLRLRSGSFGFTAVPSRACLLGSPLRGSSSACVVRAVSHHLCESNLCDGAAAKMSELGEITSLSPGSRIVVSYPSELDRFFERIWGWPVGDGTCWVSIGCDSRSGGFGQCGWLA